MPEPPVRHTDPIVPIVAQPLIIRHEYVPVPEVPKREPEVVAKPEVQPSKPVVSEEKPSIQKNNPPKAEEKPSDGSKKRKVRYEGEGGRIHTEAQIDELLDFYLMTGELPVYVSDRQRYDYRHHERLPERKELLEQRGISIDSKVSSSTGRAKNVIPIKGGKSKRKTGTGS